MENYHINRQENTSGSQNWQHTVNSEDRYREGNDINMPSRYRRNEPYFGNLSDYDARGMTWGPDDGTGRQRPGTHSGKGPRSFRRSDESIREKVCEGLTDDPHVDASEIEVEVKNSEVILKGHVGDRDSKWRAEDIAEHVVGTTRVENQIRVQHGESPEKDLRSKSTDTFN